MGILNKFTSSFRHAPLLVLDWRNDVKYDVSELFLHWSPYSL